MTSPTTEFSISQRRAQILADLKAASDPAATLVAVSKRQSEGRVQDMLMTGQRVFGENRVQEAQSRWAGLRDEYANLELRLIGGLQSNKAEEAVVLFDVIETVDRPKLVKALSAAMEKTGKTPDFLIQVNTGEEVQKSGVSPNELDDLYHLATQEYGLNVTGLMCIPPADEPAGPHFALLAKQAARLGLHVLSMGMSSDYALAAGFGATHVRVGTALFGSRED